METNARLMKLLAANPAQLEQIDAILEGSLPDNRRDPDEPLLVGVGNAARRLGISRSTLWRMISSNRLRKIELYPGAYRVRVSDLHALASGGSTELAPPQSPSSATRRKEVGHA